VDLAQELVQRRRADWHQNLAKVDAVPKKNDDPVEAMKRTAQNLASQARKLRDQARDLSQESSQLRRASKKAREERSKKRRTA